MRSFQQTLALFALIVLGAERPASAQTSVGSADLSLRIATLTNPSGQRTRFTVTNAGPAVAQNVRLSELWIAPSGVPRGTCLCQTPALQPGQSVEFVQEWQFSAPYNGPFPPQPRPLENETALIVATAVSDQPDPRSDDNRSLLLMSVQGALSVPAAYLTTGQRIQARLLVPFNFIPFQPPVDVSGSYALHSSSQAVLQAPASVTVPQGSATADFELLAGTPGRATLTVSLKNFQETLTIDVVAPGTTPRFDSRLSATLWPQIQSWGAATNFHGVVSGRSPVTDARPAGSVLLTVGSATPVAVPLDAAGNFSFTPASPILPGTHAIRYAYPGDSRFLPSAATSTLIVTDPDQIRVDGFAPPTAVVGKTFVYAVTVRNDSGIEAQNLEVTIPAPPATSVVSVNQKRGPAYTCRSSGSPPITRCSIARLAPGQPGEAEFEIEYRVGVPMAGTALTLRTQVTSSIANPAGVYDRGLQSVEVMFPANVPATSGAVLIALAAAFATVAAFRLRL